MWADSRLAGTSWRLCRSSWAKGTLFTSHDGGKTLGYMEGPGADGAISALRSREAGNRLVAASSADGLFVLEMGSASLRSRRFKRCFATGAAVGVFV